MKELIKNHGNQFELVYSGKIDKKDLLLNKDNVFPATLYIDEIFNIEKNIWNDGWKNMVVFGDNLQFLKTVYENKDYIIKDKVKGKVKLIYIDPPYGIGKVFKTKNGCVAYKDTLKGAEFVEFLRRRLILAKEILADDGSIYVHCDWRISHLVRFLLDNIFGKENFVNEIIWHYKRWTNVSSSFQKMHDNIFLYAKNNNLKIFNLLFQKYSNPEWIEDTVRGIVNGKLVRLKDEKGNYIKRTKENKGVPMHDVWEDINFIGPTASERMDYPTQKPEALLERIIRVSSNKGDLILDFFSGSGTTAAVAEKLGRKWIAVDSSNLAYNTIKNRILQIENSKDLENTKKKYGKKAKSFMLVKLHTNSK